MTAAEERLAERLDGRPGAFQVAQHRLEVRLVVAQRAVQLLPRLEELAHLVDLRADVTGREHLWRHRRELDVGRALVVFRRLVRLGERRVVVSRAELHSVQHDAQLAHAERAHGVGVVVDVQVRLAAVRLAVVGARALARVSDLLDARVAVGAALLRQLQL